MNFNLNIIFLFAFAISNVCVAQKTDSIPADSLYKQAWNNLYIKINRSDIFAEHDSTVLILKTNEHPNFVIPIKSHVISKYGSRGKSFHTGTDIKCNLGDEIVSAFDGKVRMARVFSGYGNVVVVRHYNGLETVYSHLSTIKVKVNDNVKAGEVIGLGGRTGRATTEHLHFEVRFLEEAFNAEKIIDFTEGKLIVDTLTISKPLFGIVKKTVAQNPIANNAENPNSQNYHFVKKGDTLYSISKKYGKTVSNLCELNHFSDNQVLSIGMKILVQ